MRRELKARKWQEHELHIAAQQAAAAARRAAKEQHRMEALAALSIQAGPFKKKNRRGKNTGKNSRKKGKGQRVVKLGEDVLQEAAGAP